MLYFSGLIVGAVIRYTSLPAIESTSHADLINYSKTSPPEAIFIDFKEKIHNITELKIIKYTLDKIVTEIEEEAPLEKTVSINV